LGKGYQGNGGGDLKIGDRRITIDLLTGDENIQQAVLINDFACQPDAFGKADQMGRAIDMNPRRTARGLSEVRISVRAWHG